MPLHNRNIYQRARESAGYTQERAAELLDISVESMRAYETDRRIPPDRVVMGMVEVYGTQHLAYQHLKQSTELGRLYLPDVTVQNLPTAILKVCKEINDFMAMRDKLVEIGSDGVIDVREMPIFNAIIAELDQIMAATLALKMSIKE
jgi:transcriptional regulator with XRE-family HTH domain